MNYRRSIASGSTYFFTLVAHNRRNLFRDKVAIQLLKESIKYVKQRHPFVIDAFVLLPDHLHCIWTLPDNDVNFSLRWMLVKSYFSRHYRSSEKLTVQSPSRQKKREQEIWQRRFWEHCIKDEDDFINHVEYIHYNPVKHGLVLAPKDWLHSSFHKYVKEGIYQLNWGESHIRFKNTVGYE